MLKKAFVCYVLSKYYFYLIKLDIQIILDLKQIEFSPVNKKIKRKEKVN
jgi:hypothetical protein